MNVKPLQDRVVVKRIEAAKQTSAGIYIPETATEKPDQGIVLAVGEGRATEAGQVIPLTVKVNDKVLFGKFAGQTVTLGDEEVLVLREEEIFGILEE